MTVQKFFTCLLFVLAVRFLSLCNKSETQTEPPGAVEIKDTVIASNLNHPWEIIWGPDDHIWMTERSGRVSRLNPATGQLIPIHHVTDIVSKGEGGLLGMALHPEFANNPFVYLSYNFEDAAGYQEKVVRFRYDGTTFHTPHIIIDHLAASTVHNGSRLLFVNDKLFITTGDAARITLPQDKTSPNGKILRLNADGSIPADNPEPGNAYWSFGHRNPQGLVFANNMLYSSEHGPSNDDELNVIEKGRNYGWPTVHGFCNSPNEQSFCTTNQVVEPLMAWTPTIATCGLDYYNSDLIPQWKNSLLMTTLKNSRLYQLKMDDSFIGITHTNEYLVNKYGRLRDLCISPEGRVYISTSNGGNDKIIEISNK